MSNYHKAKYWKVDETRLVVPVQLKISTTLLQELDNLLLDVAISTGKKRYWSRSRLIEALIELGLRERIKDKEKLKELEEFDFR